MVIFPTQVNKARVVCGLRRMPDTVEEHTWVVIHFIAKRHVIRQRGRGYLLHHSRQSG